MSTHFHPLARLSPQLCIMNIKISLDSNPLCETFILKCQGFESPDYFWNRHRYLKEGLGVLASVSVAAMRGKLHSGHITALLQHERFPPSTVL